jgi:hypothetical protein
MRNATLVSHQARFRRKTESQTCPFEPRQSQPKPYSLPIGRKRVTGYLRGVLLALLSLASFGVAAGPRIAISPEELDMGRVKQGAFAERKLSVKNLGDAPLVVQSGNPDTVS